MSLLWQYAFEKTFPFVVIDYEYNQPQGLMHLHDHLEIALCVEGKGNFLFPNKTLSIQKGDIFFIAPLHNHVAISHPSSTLKLILILFLPDLLNSIWLKNTDKAYLELFWNHMGKEILKVDSSSSEALELTQIIQVIHTTWHDNSIANTLLLDGYLKVLLAKSLHYYKQDYPDIKTVNINQRIKLQPILDYIYIHSHTSLNLKDVCQLAHLSESQFRVNFKQATHMTFKQYLHYIRITKSLQLLTSTNLCITDIALQVGFSNITHFYQLFKSYTGLSPAQYRTSHPPFTLADHRF